METFKNKEELKSHIESTLFCLKEYEGGECHILYNPIVSKKDRKKIFFIKKYDSQFGHIYFSLDQVVDMFIELEGIKFEEEE